MKKGGGRRYYRPDDVNLLCGIRTFLYEREYSIKELQAFLKSEGMGKVVKAGTQTTKTPESALPVEKKSIAQTPKSVSQGNKEQDVIEPDSPSHRQEALKNALSGLMNARKKLSGSLKNG